MGKNPYLLLDQTLKTNVSGSPLVNTNTGQVIASGQSLIGWAFSTCTGTLAALPDTTLPLQLGSNAIKVVTSGAGDTAILNIGHNWGPIDGMCIAFYWPHADGTTFTITLSTTLANFSEYHQWKHYAVQGWNFFRPTRGYTTATGGTADYSVSRRLMIACGTSGKTYHIGWIRTGMRHKPQLIIGADDEYLNVSTVLRPLMDTYGFRGYVAFSKYFEARTASYMTLAQVQAMQDTYGWDIVNHSRDHVDHNPSGTGDPLDTIVDDYRWNRDYMKANGLKAADIVVYPFGGGVQGVNDTLETAMRQIGARMARCVRRGKMTTSDNPPWDCPLTYAVNPYKCKILDPYPAGAYKAGATVLAEIDEIIAHGGTAWWMLHSVPSAAAGDSGNALIYNSGDVDIVLAGLKKRSDAGMIDVVKPTEALNKIGAVPEVRTTAAKVTYSAMPFKYCIIDADLSTNYTDAGTTTAVVGDLVYRATDITGNGRYAQQTTANQRPTLRTGTNNGKTFNYYEFAGSDDGLVTASWSALSQPYHLFVVAQFSTLASGNQYCVDGIGAGNRGGILQQGGNTPKNYASFAGSFATPVETVDTNWHLFELVPNGNLGRLIIDGVTYSDTAGAHTLTGLTIGNAYTLGAGGNVNVAHTALFNGVDHDLTGYALGYRAYLIDKYGTPNVNPPYVWNQ